MASTIYTSKPKKNKFDLSREVKMSGNMGNLYPCFIQDIIPGDSFRVNTQQMVRFSPLLAPMMHNVDFKVDYFFVPYRLVWDEWKDFITGGEDGNDLPSFPRVAITKSRASNFLTPKSLADYMGIPPYTASPSIEGAWSDVDPSQNLQSISLLPFRAYQLIWHEYFRDQNVGDEHEQHTSSGLALIGTDIYDQMTLRKTNWEKDYFTSALPFLQRGGEVTLPLGDTAPLLFGDYNSVASNEQEVVTNSFGFATNDGLKSSNSKLTNDSGSTRLIDVSGQHVVDLSNATGATINELRKASALQQWLELMARAGSRYREQIHAIFGERIADYTVQVPQYLGGGKTPIMVSEVLSTYKNEANTGTGEDRPVGDMSGHALALGDGLGFTQSFDEHGIVLGVCRVVPKSAYNQGLSKFWQKFDKFDHYFPQFANIGEQPIYNKELYVSGETGDDVDEGIFGYQQRYAEYKYAFNRVAGDFRSSLKHWELSRRFTSHPVLNQSFIECNPDDRIFAITEETEDKVWISLYHKVDALRPMPYHSNPSLT